MKYKMIENNIEYDIVENSDGHKSWYLNDKRHRENGPAIEREDIKVWFLNGKLHRENGPAIIYSNGSMYWYLNREIIHNKVKKIYIR